MSNFSTLYDAIVTRIETVLSSHVRLPNPYKIEENTETYLRLGWGVAMTSATNTKRELSCRVSIRRDFVVTITRKFYAVESNVSNKVSVEKALIEDMILLIHDFYDNTALPGALGIVEFESDAGINYVFSGKDSFLALPITFSVESFETVS